MKEVVVTLPYVRNKVLMQLRDIKQGIDFPGCWGFFGGAIDEGEVPEDSAWRELHEELGYRPDVLRKLTVDRIVELDCLTLYSFYCPLTLDLDEIVLQEGIDVGLFSVDEVESGRLRSKKIQRSFPVTPNVYVENTIRKLLDRLDI